MQRANIVATFRRLPYKIPNIEELSLPQNVIDLTNKRKGLILITGGTGSGKSTTLAAMIQKISNELEGHIITVSNFELLSAFSNSVQGLAVSDPLGIIAKPFKFLDRKETPDYFSEIINSKIQYKHYVYYK